MEDTEEIKQKLNDGLYKLRKKQNGKSVIWKFFDEIEKEDGLILVERVYCKRCDKVYKYPKKQTSNLMKHKCVHLRAHKSNPAVLNINDKNDCLETFLNFVINDCRPISITEGSGFNEIINICIKIGAKYGENVDLSTLIPSAKELSEKIKLMAEEKKQEIKHHIKDVIENGDCAVTLNLWTDNISKRNLLCATLHFQINYELVNITLGMKSVEFVTNSALNIRAKLCSIFEEYGVTNMMNVVFVTDRRIEIKTALKDLTRINCSADLFSNFLNDAFESTTELKEIIESCKQIMDYLKKSNIQNILSTNLKCHCATKWYSYFEMFKSIYDNYGKISKILNDNEETCNLLNVNMPLLQGLVEVCNDFDIIFNKLQGCISPTLCYVIPSINRIQSICASRFIEEDGIAALKRNISLQLENWRLNLSVWHKAAVFLYPPAISLQPNDIYEIKEFCMEKIINENKHFTTATATITQLQVPSIDIKDFILPQSPSLASTSSLAKKEHLPFNTSDRTSDFMLPLSPSFSSTSVLQPLSSSQSSASDISFFFPNLVKNVSHSIPENVRDEVERYANENVRLTEDFDVMRWWSNNFDKYPRLSKLATKVLSIPASSTSAERVFALAGNILTERRNGLETKTFDSILFLNSTSNKRLWQLS